MFRQDTLAGLKTSLLYKGVSFASMPTSEAARKAKEFIDAKGSMIPVEAEAMKFYLLNHAIAELEKKYHPHEILPHDALEIVGRYRLLLADLFPRLVYYTLIVITRESRHLHSKSAIKDKTDKISTGYFSFLDGLPGGSQNAASYFMSHPPLITLGDYVKCVRKVFHSGNFSPGYGGPAWGKIADALGQLIEGEFSPLTFIDTAWTLAHNNGPMFNKGFCFSMSGKKIVKVLDIQRAGQVPTFVYSHSMGWEVEEGFVTSSVYDLWKIAEREINCFKGVPSWDLIEKDGVGNYPHEKAHQTNNVQVTQIGEIKLPNPKLWVTEKEYGEIISREAA